VGDGRFDPHAPDVIASGTCWKDRAMDIEINSHVSATISLDGDDKLNVTPSGKIIPTGSTAVEVGGDNNIIIIDGIIDSHYDSKTLSSIGIKITSGSNNLIIVDYNIEDASGEIASVAG
jgi:hypothetical protein